MADHGAAAEIIAKIRHPDTEKMGFQEFRTEKAASTLDSSDTERAEPVDTSRIDLDVESKALGGAVSTGDPATEAAAGPADPDVPPDGGLEAWLQVLGSAVILVATWGLINSFGIFQAFYETTLLKDRSPSDISWIGSIQAALLLFTGVISGPLYDAGHFRLLVRVGLLMIVFGMFMTSLCTEYYHFLLAQGFCVGLGMGIIFLPSAAILSQYFLRHRALVLGLASAGSPVAGILFPIIFSNLEPRIGFGWTTRIMAFIILALSVVPIVFMHTRLPPTRGRKQAMFDATAVRDLPYVTFAAAGFFSFLTLYVPFFYVVLWAHTHHVSSPEWAPYLVTFLNAGSFFGRIIPNALADRYGALNVMCVCMIASSAIGYAWGTYSFCSLQPLFFILRRYPRASRAPGSRGGTNQASRYANPLLTHLSSTYWTLIAPVLQPPPRNSRSPRSTRLNLITRKC